jgi:hypothetical protein
MKDYLMHLICVILDRLHLILIMFFIFIIIHLKAIIRIRFLIQFFRILICFSIAMIVDVRFKYLVILLCFNIFLKLFIDQFNQGFFLCIYEYDLNIVFLLLYHGLDLGWIYYGLLCWNFFLI